MIKWIINLGLITVPFIFSRQIPIRVIKEFSGVAFAVVIGLTAIYQGSIHKFENRWLLLFLCFIPISIWYAPSFPLVFVNPSTLTFIDNTSFVSIVKELSAKNATNFWVYKPWILITIYSLSIISISSQKFKRKDVTQILNVMAICGFIMTIYVFIQAVHLDQFFGVTKRIVDGVPEAKNLTQPHLGGALGHPTFAAPFIAMQVPIALYLKRYWWAVCMIGAVALIWSQVAILALGMTLIAWLCFKKKGITVYAVTVLIMLILIGAAFYAVNPPDFLYWLNTQFNGRINTWHEMWQNFSGMPIEGSEKKFCLTGFGPGAFYYIFSLTNNSRFLQAHCDPLELMYNFGIIGLTFYIMAIGWMISHIKFKDPLTIPLFLSFLVAFIAHFGSFIAQLGVFSFYLVCIVGLLHNPMFRRGTHDIAEF